MNRVPRRVRAAPSRTIDGTAVVIQTGESEVSMLNEVGTLVWQSIDGSRDEAAIAAIVADEFEIDESTAQADVATFLEELAAAKLVDLT